ncbi:ArsR/SmtB family transcription factor [Taklimakanibacter deserti]|uniref:ArsR/SmtB family transcription factor n=1 Tax=Taklimakanibacter deserti TaxID=2267839 RepID=UPI000E649EA5
MSLFHPATDQIDLATVLSVLGDPTRLAIIGYLARNEGLEVNCSRFLDLGSKTNVSYHLARLREAGVTRTETRGTNRLISLRRADLNARFPGLLDSIIASAINIPFDMREVAKSELRELERQGTAKKGPVG